MLRNKLDRFASTNSPVTMACSFVLTMPAPAFWTEKMGCIITTDRLVGKKRGIELAISGAQTGLLLLTPEGQEDRVRTFFNGSFGCDDVGYAYEKLLERAVEFVGPPEMKPSSHVYFKYFDGNTIFLVSR